MSNLKRTSHAVYDIAYHFVWSPKYRKNLLVGPVKKRVKELFKTIAQEFEMEVRKQEAEEDHIHLFLSAPPRYSPSEIVQIFKTNSAKVLFREFPAFKKELWAGEFWKDGYFVRTVGDEVTKKVIERYIEYQSQEEQGRQLKLKLF